MVTKAASQFSWTLVHGSEKNEGKRTVVYDCVLCLREREAFVVGDECEACTYGLILLW